MKNASYKKAEEYHKELCKTIITHDRIIEIIRQVQIDTMKETLLYYESKLRNEAFCALDNDDVDDIILKVNIVDELTLKLL